MAKHVRGTSVLRLLARMNWQRDPDSWTVRCRDARGRRARLRVRLASTGISLALPSTGPWVLSPLEAGRLRGAVRDALLAFDRLARDEHDDEPDAVALPRQRTQSPTPVGEPTPRQRRRLDLRPPPSVHEITSRFSPPTTSDMEVRHDNQHAATNCEANRATLAS